MGHQATNSHELPRVEIYGNLKSGEEEFNRLKCHMAKTRGALGWPGYFRTVLEKADRLPRDLVVQTERLGLATGVGLALGVKQAECRARNVNCTVPDRRTLQQVSQSSSNLVT
jgi:hypothetical protein